MTGWEPQQHYPFESGYLSLEKTPAMTNVGCENCHGMGTRHDAFKTAGAHINETTCLTCHTGTTSPDFKFDRFKPYIDHTHKFADLPPLNTAKPMKSAAGMK